MIGKEKYILIREHCVIVHYNYVMHACETNRFRTRVLTTLVRFRYLYRNLDSPIRCSGPTLLTSELVRVANQLLAKLGKISQTLLLTDILLIYRIIDTLYGVDSKKLYLDDVLAYKYDLCTTVQYKHSERFYYIVYTKFYYS